MTTKPSLVLLRDGVWWQRFCDWEQNHKCGDCGTIIYTDICIPWCRVSPTRSGDRRIRQAIENSPGPHTPGQYEVVDVECPKCKGDGAYWDESRRNAAGMIIQNRVTGGCMPCSGTGTVPTLRKVEG